MVSRAALVERAVAVTGVPVLECAEAYCGAGEPAPCSVHAHSSPVYFRV